MKKITQWLKMMMIVFLFLECSIPVMAQDNSPLSIEVFTDSLHPVTTLTQENINLHYYLLDAPTLILQKMNRQLKETNLNQAAQKAKFIFQQNKKALQKAYRGQVLAQQYHLTQFPAFVFDHGNTIVYEQIDINQALFNYRLEKQTL